MIIITGGFTATQESTDALRDEAMAHVRRSRAEDGCISHDLLTDAEHPLRFFFYERWRDMAAVRAHFAAPESAAFVRSLRERASTIEELALYEAAPARP